MRTSFSGQERYQVATVSVPEIEINGNGGAQAPVLILPLRIDYHIHPENPRVGMRFRTVAGQIDVEHRPFATAPAINLNIVLRSDFRTLPNQLHHLYFPLDAQRIAFLERVRQGAALKFKLRVTLSIEKLCALQEPPVPTDAVWGSIYTNDLHVEEDITIPASAWTSRVLPQIGYGTVHIIELPAIPLSAVEAYQQAYQALSQAQEHHKNGLYDEAAARCRVALERFFDYPEVTGSDNLTRRIPTLKKSWETKVGRATYEWLNVSLGGIKQATNPAHHSPGPHFDQLESLILISVTVAVVAYAAKHDLPSK